MEYTIINPSDPYRMTADRFDVAAVAIALLGNGAYAARPRGEGPEVPLFVAGNANPDPWFREHFGMSYADLANEILDHRPGELIAALESVTLEAERGSSMNDIAARANAMAMAVRNRQEQASHAASQKAADGDRSCIDVPDGAVEVLAHAIAPDGHAVTIVFTSQEKADRFRNGLNEAMQVRQNA